MKKNWKRLGAMLLALVMVFSLVPTAALAARLDDEIALDAPDVVVDDSAPARQMDAGQADVPADLAEGEQPAYTIGAINAGLFDVGASPTLANGTWTANYSNANLTGIAGTACAESDSSNDGPASYALDENTGHWWHSDWNNLSESSKEENRWVGIQFTEATEVSGFRYLARTETNSNGFVMDYEIQVQKTAGGDWEKVAEGNWGSERTATDLCNGQWRLATFDAVSAIAIRLVGKTTTGAQDTESTGKYMHAVGIRAVKSGTLVPVSITGTISDGTSNLEGAKVTLVQNNTSKTFVSGVDAATTNADGAYNLDISSVPAGSYQIRVSKDGYGAVLGDPVTVGVDASYTSNATLTAINTADAKFAYDMTEGNRPELGFAEADTKPTASYVNDALVLDFPNTERMNNLVRLVGTNVKNGTIEFDAHREGTYRNPGRFGLAIRLTSATNWIFVGQWDTDIKWASEYWPNSNSSDYSRAEVEGPSFTRGDTRHFKVKIEENIVTLWIDGIQVYQQDLTNGDKAVPSTAADVGIICGNSQHGMPSTITIDNLYIFRKDPTFTVTLDNSNVTLGAKITSSAGDEALGGDDANQAAAGDVIRITGTTSETGKALGEVTVTKTGDANTTVPATLQEDGSFTFAMPKYNVTVTGALKNTYTAELPTAAPKAGKAYAVTLDPTAATASYQWYRVTAGATDVAVGRNSATYTPVSDDVNKTLKVVVTGTGDYTGIKTLTTGTVQAADIEVTGVTIARETIKMIKNGDGTNSDTTDAANTVVSGNTTTLTATVAPNNATGMGDDLVTWTVEGDAVTLGTKSRTDNVFSMPITAVQNGTATVTATATSADGTTQTDSVTITVVTKVENVTIKNGETVVASTKSDVTAEPFVLHANNGLADHPSSATLTVEVEPADASACTFNWSRVDDSETGLITITGDDANGSRTISVADTATASKVGAKELKLVVSSSAVGAALNKELTFTTTVRRYLQHTISIGLGGKDAPTFGQNMDVDVSALVVGTTDELSESAKQNLVYTWYAGENADGTGKAQIHTGTGAAGKTYTPKAEDMGKYIFVEVTATPTDSFFYEGTVSAKTSAVVVKADNANTPTLSPSKPTTQGGSDGSITITNYDSNATYEIKAEGGEWATATVTSEGKIENKAPGKYSVRIAETTTHNASAAVEVTIADADAVEYNITATQPTEGATITVTDKSTANDTVTITLNVTDGWQVDAVKVNDGAVNVTAGQNNTWTFTMPESDVTVTAEVSKIQLKIKHELTNMSCNLPNAGADHTHTVNWGEITSIQFTADEGYNLPASTADITVKVLNDNGEAGEAYTGTLTYSNGELGFGSNGLRSSVVITAAATLKSYTVSYTGMNGLNRPADTQNVNHGAEYTYTLTTQATYALPEAITVTMGSTTLTAGTDYTYNSTTGEISIPSVTGNVSIAAAGVKQYTQVTDVAISSTSLEVGSVLSTTITPSGAIAAYQWMSSAAENGTYADISGATGQTYTLKDSDIGRWIKVKVTGDRDHDYDGTATSAAVGPVTAKVIAPTGITLDRKNYTLTVGEKFTLTATIAPDDATDKTITWSVLHETQDGQVVDGVATIAPNAQDGTAVITAVDVGTVRINARTSNGRTANCTLTVERAASDKVIAVADDVTVSHDGEGHSITVNVLQPEDGYTITYATEEAGEYTEDNPVYTEVGEYTTYYKVTAPEMTEATGSAKVTITEEIVEADKTALDAAVKAADAAKKGVKELAADTDPATVSKNTKFVTPEQMDALEAAIADAQAVLDNADATEAQIAEAVTALNAAVETFKGQIQTGTKPSSSSSSSSRPSSDSTATVTNPDGSKTTTVTKPDGTVTATTEKPDGTTEVVETKKDGTVTETITDPEGGKTEKVTTPDEAVTITVTDPEGEELAKVELPAEVALPEEGKFDDINTTPWAEESILKVAGLGLVDGVGNNKYAPAAPMTRGALATVLHRLSQGKTDYQLTFQDVANDQYYAEGVAWAARAGVVKGITADIFAPDQSITREQLAVMMARYAKLIGLDTSVNADNILDVFADADKTGDWAVDGTAWCVKVGILQGRGEGILDPNTSVTRAEVAVMLDRFIAVIMK